MSPLLLGVDAGNSKTLAVVADAEGRILGRGRAGAGDIYSAVGADSAVGAVLTAAEAALAEAGVAVGQLAGAAFRLAGVDWPEDEAFWRDAIRAAMPALAAYTVKNDGFSLLRLGDPGGSGVGVSVVLGTGGAMAARGPGGDECSLSFWSQDPLGALGLGSAAFRAVIRAELGIDPPTLLGARMAAQFGCADVPELLHAFTRRVGARPEWQRAEASRAVLQAAAEGDAVAVGIVHAQAATVVDYAGALARRAGIDPASGFALPLGGSLVSAGHRLFGDALLAAIGAAFPAARVQGLAAAPVIGAVLDAMAEAHLTPSAEALTRLTGTPHPPGFLTT